jgi:hypothetical protein
VSISANETADSGDRDRWWRDSLKMGRAVLETKTLYTLAVGYENSIYIEASLGHKGSSAGAQKSSTVKRNDTGLQLVSQSDF